MKKVLALLLAFVMVLSLCACGGAKTDTADKGDTKTETKTDTGKKDSGKTDTADTPKRDTLNIAFSQDRGTLNPMYMMGYDGLNVLHMLYEALWDWDSQGNQIWILATGLEMKDEGRTWIIHIREGVKFSNGNPLTAEDVVFTLDKANHRTGEPDYFPEMDLENTKALDDYTVEVKFFNYDMSYISSITSMLIFDKESFDEESIAQTPIGTGPYKLDEYVVNSHINLSIRDGYWGEKPAIEHLNFKVLAEDAQKTNALATGEIDISKVPFQDIDYVKTIDGYNVDIIGGSGSKALYLNTNSTSVFYDNVDARQAVAYAIDREAIADIVYSGYATESRLPVAMGNIDVTDDLLDYGVYGDSYNVEKAKALAESSGLAGKTVKLITNGASDSVTCAELIKDNLREIGVEVNIVNYDTGSWLSYAFDPTASDMLVDGTGVPSKTIAQNMSCWYLYHLGGAFTYNPFPGQARYDELCEGIMAISDEKELHDRYVEMCRLETDGMLWYSLVDMQSAMAYPSNIEGWDVMRMGNTNYANLRFVD